MFSTTIYQYHYLYRITNLVEQKHYYGIRTTKNTLPHKDLGVKYFSSSRDKEFKKDQRLHPENYKYKVIITSDSRQRILELEIKLHNKFNVGVNPKFYNNAIQTSVGFDPSGKVVMRDKEGNCIQLDVDDPKIMSEELFFITKGGRWIYNPETKQNIILMSGEELPIGFVFGKSYSPVPKNSRWIHNTETKQNIRISFDEKILEGWEVGRVNELGEKFISYLLPTGSRRIFNSELKKNRMLKPGEILPIGWEYGIYKIKPTASIEKGSVAIHSLELGKTRYIKQSEEIPLGWDRGILPGKYIHNKALGFEKRITINDSIPYDWDVGRLRINPSTKGNRWIYNSELKQNKNLKPGETLPIGWSYGMKRSWK